LKSSASPAEVASAAAAIPAIQNEPRRTAIAGQIRGLKPEQALRQLSDMITAPGAGLSSVSNRWHRPEVSAKRPFRCYQPAIIGLTDNRPFPILRWPVIPDRWLNKGNTNGVS
jgi:hypothetical protein